MKRTHQRDLSCNAVDDVDAREPFGLLEGVRVLDLSTSIAGPYATMCLGDLGAEVLKVERPAGGDDARSWGPPFVDGLSLWFASVNRNKRSLALDYGLPDGYEQLLSLVECADVLVVNSRPDSQVRLGIDQQTLRARNPALVHCSVTGFGLTGPNCDRASYDLIAEGYSGIMDLTGERDGPPQKVGSPIADLAAGIDAAFAIVSALFAGQRDGRGHAIDISLVESMTKLLTPRLVPFLGEGKLPRRSGGRDSVIAIYQTFETADEPITLGLGTDEIFRRFSAAIGRDDWGGDPRYTSNAGRRRHRAQLVAEIAAVLAGRGRNHWIETFARARVPAGPVNRLDEAAGDPHLRNRGLFVSVRDSAGRTIPQVGTGWWLDGSANARYLPPPEIGEGGGKVAEVWLSCR